MSVINILPPHVADMIAAGEVVERPASVVKELMENAFDAGARNLTVEVRDGGATGIRVIDDGCGMAPEDAGVAFLRHATSKLHDEHGLDAIGTMGFRGEALAAISAVSRIELVTRRAQDAEGVRVSLEAGEIQDMGPTGCRAGTSMSVRDLFYNTPARLKFLKSDRAEASACVQTALRCALGRPEVSVRLIRDGKEEFFTPGDGKPESAVYALLGRELASTLLPVRSESQGLRVHGFLSSPSAGRGNRSAQFFFCNGRYIRSALLQAALEQGYKNTLLSGRYPACVLYLELSPGSVDVNVHPAKTEVKFSQEKQVFDLVYQAVTATLQGEDRLSAAPAPAASTQAQARPSVPAQVKPRQDFYQTMSAQDYRQAMEKGRLSPLEAAGKPVTPAPKPPREADRPGIVPPLFSPEARVQAREPESQERIFPSEELYSAQTPSFPQISTLSAPVSGQKVVENLVQNVESSPVPDHKILGEAMKTYILVEMGDELILIDKHAAHERMNFDRLKARDREILSQRLLLPVPMKVSGEDEELLEQYGELLTDLGFEIEPFGAGQVVLRAVPAELDPGESQAAVEEILEKLRRGKAPDAQSARDEILHTVACKAAIKAGWDTDRRELEAIVREVLSGRVKYCPHGRPVSAILTRKDLDKMFKRIV